MPSPNRVGSKVKQYGATAWQGTSNLIRLADAAKIPLVGGAFGVTVAIIDSFEEASTNQEQCKQILDLLADYGNIIWEFVKAMDPDYILESDERQADIARRAIKEFGGAMDHVSVVIRLHTHRSLLKRVWYRRKTKDDITDCEETLNRALERFKASLQNILVAQAHDSNQTSEEIQRILEAQIPEIEDHFKLAGAKALHATSIIRGTHLTAESDVAEDRDKEDFWVSIWEVELEGKPRLAKFYNTLAGGEEAFRRDIDALGKRWNKNFPRIIGHCIDAIPPFIVFEESSFTPTKRTRTLPKPKAKPPPPVMEPEERRAIREAAAMLTFLDEHLDRINKPV